MPTDLHDEIASTSIALYSALPKHGKPRVRDNGVPEWTILATVSMVQGRKITSISLGAGVKVLPANRLPPLGDTVHDCHAEILARRGFVRWLAEEAQRLVTGQDHLGLLQQTDEGKIRIRDGVQVWLYVSALPCGDASTLHTAAHQPADMAALKSSPDGQIPVVQAGQAIRGRNGYESFGSIRTKPGRADSNPTICMSCSDKMASWNVLGLQGALLAPLFEEPIYLDGIVVGGPEEVPPAAANLGEGEVWWDVIRREAERSFYGRLSSLDGSLKAPYRLNRPAVHLTTVLFRLSKPEVAARYPEGPEPVPNVQCVLHIPPLEISEVLHNGCKSGGGWKPPGKDLLPQKARSVVCKYEIFQAYQRLLKTLRAEECSGRTYYDHKYLPESSYQTAKSALRGTPGPPQVLVGFEKCGEFSLTASAFQEVEPPFVGWIVSGERWENFTATGRLQP